MASGPEQGSSSYDFSGQVSIILKSHCLGDQQRCAGSQGFPSPEGKIFSVELNTNVKSKKGVGKKKPKTNEWGFSPQLERRWLVFRKQRGGKETDVPRHLLCDKHQPQLYTSLCWKEEAAIPSPQQGRVENAALCMDSQGGYIMYSRICNLLFCQLLVLIKTSIKIL
ncbi:uncharacterized protein LOC103270091 [Carlito syrichta]|uniref:Uncharacterized protein LOC103270091 n=1 Tax=Carlito syrichta TaxID=1868482 RepID=A0A3Q0EEN4_CARSF|nr:uncharacterized protein LOC103270091 [Carlito syrichta]